VIKTNRTVSTGEKTSWYDSLRSLRWCWDQASGTLAQQLTTDGGGVQWLKAKLLDRNSKLCQLRFVRSQQIIVCLQQHCTFTQYLYIFQSVQHYGPALVVQWINHLGTIWGTAWRDVVGRFSPSLGPVRRICLLKNYFIIIPTRMMIREIIPGRRVRWCPLKTVTVAGILISSVKVPAAPMLSASDRCG